MKMGYVEEFDGFERFELINLEFLESLDSLDISAPLGAKLNLKPKI